MAKRKPPCATCQGTQALATERCPACTSERSGILPRETRKLYLELFARFGQWEPGLFLFVNAVSPDLRAEGERARALYLAKVQPILDRSEPGEFGMIPSARRPAGSDVRTVRAGHAAVAEWAWRAAKRTNPNENKPVMKLQVQVLVFQTQEGFVAQCINFDFAAQGQSVEETLARFQKAFMCQLIADLKDKRLPFSTMQRTPTRYELMYTQQAYLSYLMEICF